MEARLLDSAAVGAALGQVETLMARLVRGPEDDVLGPIAQSHLDTGGKRLRARLALAATQALGGAERAGVAWAAACELAHNATLIHDDLQDGDRMRRGQPTTWVRHGMAQAINAGDLLLMLPYSAICDTPCAGALCDATARFMCTVIRGQAAECRLTEQTHIDAQHYAAMIRGKTSALFELPVYGAALLGGADAASAARLTSPFAPLGMLFQMQDDVLDLYGDKGRDAPGSDLREGKISALVVQHLALHPDDETWLMQLLRQPRAETPETEVQRAIARFMDGGAVRAVMADIERQAARALQDVSPQLQPLMRELIDLVLGPVVRRLQPP